MSRKDPERKLKLILALRISTIVANFIVFATMIVEAVIFVKVLDGFYGSCPSPWTAPDCNLTGFVKFMQRLGWVSGTYYTILTLSLVIIYVMLNQQLKRILSRSISTEVLKTINLLFGVLVVSYVLRTIFLYF